CKKNRLPAYSFIEPRYANGQDPATNTFFSASDQHPDHNVEQGEILIRDTFNAIWNNQTLRESTLLVIVYDEHGGLYDHVPPPAPKHTQNKNCARPPHLFAPFFFSPPPGLPPPRRFFFPIHPPRHDRSPRLRSQLHHPHCLQPSFKKRSRRFAHESR